MTVDSLLGSLCGIWIPEIAVNELSLGAEVRAWIQIGE